MFGNLSISDSLGFSNSSQDNSIDYIDLSTIELLTGFVDKDSEDNKDDKGLKFILWTLFISLKLGSTSLKLDKDHFNKIHSNQDGDKISEYYELFCSNFKKGRYASLIGEDGEFKPLIYDKGNNNFYFHKYFESEKSIKKVIRDKVSLKFTKPDNYEDIKKVTKEIFSETALDTRQKIAIVNSILMNFFIISGGPGTGKTTVIVAILLALLRLKPDRDLTKIALLSPTGRASARIGESIKEQIEKNQEKGYKLTEDEKGKLSKLNPKTIHRLLKYNPVTKKFTYNKKNLLDMEVVIVDETSMVDLVLMSNFLQALHLKTKIIFVGDKDQLPSVDAGAVLSDLIPHTSSDSLSLENLKLLKDIIGDEIDGIKQATEHALLTDHFVILQTTYRNSGSIKEVCEILNSDIEPGGENGDAKVDRILSSLKVVKSYDDCKATDNKNLFLIDNIDNRDRLYSLLDRWFAKNFTKNSEFKELLSGIRAYNIQNELQNENKHLLGIFEELFGIINQNKIVTFLRETAFGSVNINQYLEKRFVSYFKDISGVPIIVTKNDYKKNIFNGDIGILLIDQSKVTNCVLKVSGKPKIFDIKTISDYEYAFAITVHKCQGSEYEDILLILPNDMDNRLLKKELLYTGITRAKKSATICSTRDVLKKSITTKSERVSGFDFWNI